MDAPKRLRMEKGSCVDLSVPTLDRKITFFTCHHQFFNTCMGIRSITKKPEDFM